MPMDKIFHQSPQLVGHPSCRKSPPHAKINKFIKAVNHHYKHHFESPNKVRTYKKQPAGETNRPEYRHAHYTTYSGKTKGKSNTRKSHLSTTSSCRDRSPTPYPHKSNKICKDANKLPHMDTKSLQIDTVTTHQNSQSSIDFPSFQDHLLPEASYQQFSSKNNHFKTICQTKSTHQQCSSKNQPFQDHFLQEASFQQFSSKKQSFQVLCKTVCI